jgi:hypothetical protein
VKKKTFHNGGKSFSVSIILWIYICVYVQVLRQSIIRKLFSTTDAAWLEGIGWQKESDEK